MPATGQLKPLGVPANRAGEGTAVSVVLGHSINVNGHTIQSAAIDLTKAPVPERKYAANMYSVASEPGTVQLLFGQKRIGGNDLRSLLVIQMSPIAVTRLLQMTATLSPMSLEDIASTGGVTPEAPFRIGDEPTQTVALAAGFALVACAGEETTVDFYHASAFAVTVMSHSSQLMLDPVVRVDMRTSMLLGLIGELKKLPTNEFQRLASESVK